MGPVIGTCYRCKRPLHEADFHRGLAVRIGSLFTCDACAQPLLARLTPEQRKAVYARLEAAAAERPPARHIPPASAPPERTDTQSSTAPGRAGPAPRKAGVPRVVWIAGAGAVLLLLLVLIVVLAVGSGRQPEGTPEAPARAGGASRRPVTPPPAEPVAPRTPDGARHSETVLADIAALDKEIRARTEAQEYQKALDALQSARARHPDLSWTQAVDRLTREVRDAVGGAYIRLVPNFREALDADADDRIRAYQGDVETWGIPGYIDEVNRQIVEWEKARAVPLARWRMDRGGGATVVDETGRHPVTLTNVQRAEGRGGGVMDFDGSGWALIGNPGGLDSSRTFTWTAWIRTSGSGPILARTGPGSAWVAGGKVFFVRGGRLTLDVGWVGAVQSLGTVNDNAWHHVAMTLKDGAVKFYIDGRPSGGGPLDVRRAPEAGYPLKIGYCNENFPEQSGFKGQIDDVRWYATALDAKAIGRLATKPD